MAERKAKIVRQLKRAGLPCHKEELQEGVTALGAITSSRPYHLSAARSKLVMLVVVTESLAAQFIYKTKGDARVDTLSARCDRSHW